MRLRARLQLQSETRALSLGDARSVLHLVWTVTFGMEAVAALWLAWRWATAYGKPWGEAAWLGVFHAISAFNNAGFSPYADSMMGFAHDGWLLAPLMLCVVIGGIGFPVFFELWRRLLARWRARMNAQPRPRERLSLHAQLTAWGTLALLLGGTLGVAWAEWDNPRTLGAMGTSDKWLNALFTSVVARTAGFNSIDLGAVSTETYVLHYLLMFIGGGSAGTAGGVKVVTFAVLLLAVWSELRGHPDLAWRGRRIAPEVLRQALTLMVLSSALLALAMLVLVPLCEGVRYEQLLFEVVSAFGTVGVSAGITAQLPVSAQLVLVALMFLGRVGVVTLGVALALRGRRTAIRYPEEKPLVG